MILLALLLFFGASQQGAAGERALALAGRRARDAMATRFERLQPQEPLERAALLLLRTAQEDFPVIDAWGRPVDVQEGLDGALYLSDDRAGAVYRITFSG